MTDEAKGNKYTRYRKIEETNNNQVNNILNPNDKIHETVNKLRKKQ